MKQGVAPMIAWDVASATRANVHVRQVMKATIAVERFQRLHRVSCLQDLSPLHLHLDIWGTLWLSLQTTCLQFVLKSAIKMENAMMMGHASAFLGTVETLARISAHSRAAVKVNASMVPACAWPDLLALTAVKKFAVLAMVIATFPMCVSATGVGPELLAPFQWFALIQSAQAMESVMLGFATVSLAGEVQSVQKHLLNVTHLVALMVLVIAQQDLAHAKQAGVAMIA